LCSGWLSKTMMRMWRRSPRPYGVINYSLDTKTLLAIRIIKCTRYIEHTTAYTYKNVSSSALYLIGIGIIICTSSGPTTNTDKPPSLSTKQFSNAAAVPTPAQFQLTGSNAAHYYYGILEIEELARITYFSLPIPYITIRSSGSKKNRLLEKNYTFRQGRILNY